MSERKQYEQIYNTMHKHPQRFRGVSTEKHVANIKFLIEETQSKSLLDFGCGKGQQYTKQRIHKQWGGIKPTLYDPGVPSYEELPFGMWDGVICIDVLEHVPESAILDVLFDIISRARKFIFINVSTRRAGINLPNGENAHCTIKEHKWWENKISNMKQKIDSSAIIFLESRKYTKDKIIQTRI